MKKSIYLILILFSIIINCGGGSGSTECTFDISQLYNCNSINETIVTQWICSLNDKNVAVVICADGSGWSSDEGAIMWSDAGCAKLEITSASNTTIDTFDCNENYTTCSITENGQRAVCIKMAVENN